MPKTIIQQAFNEALKSSLLEQEHKIDFVKETKAVSSIINEFKEKNRIVKEKSSLLEEEFKKNLEKLTIVELEKIENTEKPNRQSEFKVNFPAYFEFIDTLLNKIVPAPIST